MYCDSNTNENSIKSDQYVTSLGIEPRFFAADYANVNPFHYEALTLLGIEPRFFAADYANMNPFHYKAVLPVIIKLLKV